LSWELHKELKGIVKHTLINFENQQLHIGICYKVQYEYTVKAKGYLFGRINGKQTK